MSNLSLGLNKDFKKLLPSDFNWKNYITLNQDLIKLDKNRAEEHYVTFGFREGRKYKTNQDISQPDFLLPSDFMWQDYIKLNQDLKNLTKKEAERHYFKHGFREGRSYILKKESSYGLTTSLPVEFDWIVYLKLNSDLGNLSKEKAEKHYLKYGMREGRLFLSDKETVSQRSDLLLPSDFDWREYIRLNEDLHNLTQIQAENHYYKHGLREKRKYNIYKEPSSNLINLLPKDFNWRNYLELNKDLLYTSKAKAENHYLRYGFQEGRSYIGQHQQEIIKNIPGLPEDFNWISYKQLNNFPSNMGKHKAELHYIRYGKKEQRKYKYDKKTYSIGGRIFLEPVDSTPLKTFFEDKSQIINNYGKTTICFISQGESKYELMSKILGLSLRCYNPDIDIIAGLPTPFEIYPKVSPETLSLFDNLNIKYIEITNQISHKYKIGNKYALLEKVSEISENSYILFLDTDIICTNTFNPTKEMLESDLSGITTDYSDWVNKINKKNFKRSFWYRIHSVCDTEYNPEKYNPPYLSCVTKKPIYADYLNGGYIFIKNNPLISKTLNLFTQKIYKYLNNRPNTPSFTSDQIAIAVTCSKLNLNTHILDMEHVYSCIPKHYPSGIIKKQQFFHYHKPKCLRSIFINLDHRQYNLNYKGVYRRGDNLLFDNYTFFKIVNCMFNDWKYLFRPKEVNDEDVEKDFSCFYLFLREFISKNRKISWSDSINRKSIYQVIEYLKHESVSNTDNKFLSYLINKKNLSTQGCKSLYDLISQESLNIN